MALGARPLASAALASHRAAVGGNTVLVPAASITFAGAIPVVNRTQSVIVPATGITFSGAVPIVNRTQSVIVPAAGITFAGVTPTVNRTQSVVVPAANVNWASAAPVVTVSGIVLPPAALALMYGGGGMWPDRKWKGRKKEEEETIAEMVFELSKSQEDKKAVIKVLPKKWQEDFPSPQLALVSDLVKRFESSTRFVQEKLARLYQARIVEEERLFLAERVRLEEEDEEDALFLLM